MLAVPQPESLLYPEFLLAVELPEYGSAVWTSVAAVAEAASATSATLSKTLT